jgi:DMSO/TMAO reductase YedYZ molybdopterin-dependent catalytic subunit
MHDTPEMSTESARRRFATIALACIAIVAASSVSGQSSTVRIEGNVAQSLSLTVEDLKRYPVRTLDYAPRSESERGNAGAAAPRQYTGCLLRDVLAAAKLTEKAPRDLRKSYVVVSASDGYQVVFSWAELFIAPAGDSVLVAYARDGAPLGESEGPIALIAATDKSPVRHVKWLQTIQVKSAAP